MTQQKDLKKRIRERQARTGERYSTARMHVLGDQMETLAPKAPASTRTEAVVLTVGPHSARLRIFGEEGEVTFRSGDLYELAPAHVVTLLVEKRWVWRGDAYASGKVAETRIDIPRLGLTALALEGGEPEDVREYSEACRGSGPYSELRRNLTAKPRPSYELDELAWGAFPGADPEDNPTCKAAELRALGRDAEARALLMHALGRDLRVLDAHAGLGSMVFERSPERALVHYEIGVRIGELSVPVGFDGLLTWRRLYNRPFLRCLHGYGLCMWRRGDLAGAKKTFERILSLDPDDHQGVRFCWQDVQAGRSWEETNAREDAASSGAMYPDRVVAGSRATVNQNGQSSSCVSSSPPTDHVSSASGSSVKSSSRSTKARAAASAASRSVRR